MRCKHTLCHPVHKQESCCGPDHILLLYLQEPLPALRKGNPLPLCRISPLTDSIHFSSQHLFLPLSVEYYQSGDSVLLLPLLLPLSSPSVHRTDESADQKYRIPDHLLPLQY